MMNRREFLAAGAAVSAAVSIARAQDQPASPEEAKRTFNLAYAPHFGMFSHHAGNDPIDQLKFIADQGFTALEDNGMKGRSKEDQGKIAAEMERLGLRMGVFVATGSFSDPTFASGD